MDGYQKGWPQVRQPPLTISIQVAHDPQRGRPNNGRSHNEIDYKNRLHIKNGLL